MLFSEIPPADRTLSAILGYGAFVAVLLLLALIVFLIVRKIKRKQKREMPENTRIFQEIAGPRGMEITICLFRQLYDILFTFHLTNLRTPLSCMTQNLKKWTRRNPT